MAKKFISIVLSLLLAFSCFAIVSVAGDGDTITDEDRALYPEEELAITDPKDRIDRALLTGRMWSYQLQDTAASEDVLEDNLSYWKDEIIDEYHALAAKGDAATDEEWGALYRKMKTPHNNDFENYGDFWYEYRDLTKGQATAKFVPSKTELEPGEEFTVDLYVSTDFWFSGMYATVFYDNSVIDVVGCSEGYYGTAKKNGHTEDINVHTLGESFDGFDYLEINHYGIYDLTGEGDIRNLEWPTTLVEEEGALDTFEAYNVGIYANGKGTATAKQGEDILVMTYKFKVKDDAKVGDSSPIFCPDDSMWTTSKLDVYDNYSAETGSWMTPCWQFYRCDKGSQADYCLFSDPMYLFDKGLSIEGDLITVVGEDVELADYTELDAAIADFDASVSGLYTTDSWATYSAAVDAGKSLSRELPATEQGTVNAATAAITDAKATLVLNHLTGVEVVGTPTIGANANVEVSVTGSPLAVRFINADGNALTFTRDDATIVSTDDGETWTVKVPATSEKAEYDVFAKWGDDYNPEGLPLVIEAVEGQDLSIHSIEVPDMYDGMGGKIYLGVHDVIVRTSKDVFKIQFVDPDGNTRTFSSADLAPVEDGDELVWTIPYKFSVLGNNELAIRTRAVNTTFAFTGDYMTCRVVF